MKKISVYYFHDSIRVAIDSFVSHWKFRNFHSPKQWPDKMNWSEWNEQWIAYLMELEDRKQAEREEKQEVIE